MTDALDVAVEDIRMHARRVLSQAGVGDQLPVPIDAIAAAVDLEKGELFGVEDAMPPELQAIVAKLKGTVLGALSVDERRYFVDPSLPVERRRFTEAHEIGHDALPWHAQAYFAEDRTTLTSNTRVLLEAEANQFAAEILFSADRFTEEADAHAPSIDVPLGMNGIYQTSAAAALRRYVTNSRRPLALLATGLKQSRLGHLPIYDASCQSASFQAKFGAVRSLYNDWLGPEQYPMVRTLSPSYRGTIGETDVSLPTARGHVRLLAEGFGNGHNGFVLLRERNGS